MAKKVYISFNCGAEWLPPKELPGVLASADDETGPRLTRTRAGTLRLLYRADDGFPYCAEISEFDTRGKKWGDFSVRVSTPKVAAVYKGTPMKTDCTPYPSFDYRSQTEFLYLTDSGKVSLGEFQQGGFFNMHDPDSHYVASGKPMGTPLSVLGPTAVGHPDNYGSETVLVRSNDGTVSCLEEIGPVGQAAKADISEPVSNKYINAVMYDGLVYFFYQSPGTGDSTARYVTYDGNHWSAPRSLPHESWLAPGVATFRGRLYIACLAGHNTVQYSAFDGIAVGTIKTMPNILSGGAVELCPYEEADALACVWPAV